MESNNNQKITYSGWQVALIAGMIYFGSRGIESLFGRHVPSNNPTIAQRFSSNALVPTAPIAQQHKSTLAYSPEFEQWWGGQDQDASLARMLEGRFVEYYGVLPNEQQKQFIRTTFAPAIKNYGYSTYLKEGLNEDKLGAAGKDFMKEYGTSFFTQMLSLADKEQLKELRQDVSQSQN